MIGVVMMTQSDLMSVYNDIATDFNESISESDNLIISQGWRVLDGTRFLPWYLPVNTVLGKTGFGHLKWKKPGKTQLRPWLSNLVHQ